MDARVEQLGDLAIGAFERLGVDYAIGGAVAMAAYGYERATKDIDVFALEEDTATVMRGLRAAGLRIVPIMPPYHYAAYLPDERDPERRVDVLFPSSEPELSAVEYPERVDIFGRRANAFPITLLVMAKFYANREDRDIPDIAAMLKRGMFDPNEVHTILARVDPDEAAEFSTLIARLQQPATKRRRPTGRIREPKKRRPPFGV